MLKPPRTDIPAIDEYYRTYDTQAHITIYNQTVEFERARDGIFKYWHQMNTPLSEQKAVQQFLTTSCSLENMVLYLSFMKKYYEQERTIYNLSEER